ncbi:MAG: Na+/H+ antiporter subunit E, partial [Chloroflexota bacterium]
GGLAVGYLIGLGVMLLTGHGNVRLNVLRLPVQLFWGVVYAVRLFIDILLSSIDVTRRVLDPALPINPGEIRISTRDESCDVLTSALSAHAITVTPGEMVVGFEEQENEVIMTVHTLDLEASSTNAEDEQINRLKFIRRMLGGNA